MSVQLERQVRRMPSTKGYRSYHGKGGAGRIVLIVLLCLILLAAVGFLVLQRYAVYGSDGSIRFDLPWKQTEEPSGPSAPDGASRTPDAPDDSPDVIIDEPEPPAKPELTELHGAELSESVLRGNADAALAAVPEGANAVALRVKNARGELLYDSALQEAIDVNAVKGGSGANAVIEALTGSEVYTIARIAFVDFVRRRQDDLSIDDRFYAPASSAPTPEESVINLQQRSQIEQYLDRLAPRYRQLILMRFFEEYSYEEIAAKLALPLGTVKTQIHRAREQMCRLIAAGENK